MLFVSLDKTPTLHELTAPLLPRLAPYWEQFCIAADLDEDGTTLGIIEQECRSDPGACCRKMFRKWMQKERPTWGRVIECLREAGCSQLADEVKEKVLQGEKKGICFRLFCHSYTPYW